MKVILTIAGSDTSAGAGIQQDLKTITSLGHYAVTVPTALTAQNTVGVMRVMPVPSDMLKAQIDAVLTDIKVDAIKIGMIPNKESAEVIVSALKEFALPIVCDPVMISTSGTQLMSDDCIEYVQTHLFPLCTLATPNLPEALRLLQGEKTSEAKCLIDNSLDTDDLGRGLVRLLGTSALIKGGHRDSEMMYDTLYQVDGSVHTYSSPRIATRNLHGTGCTMSSAIATYLAQGSSLPDAVAGAKGVIDRGIVAGRDLDIGHGNGPLWLF